MMAMAMAMGKARGRWGSTMVTGPLRALCSLLVLLGHHQGLRMRLLTVLESKGEGGVKRESSWHAAFTMRWHWCSPLQQTLNWLCLLTPTDGIMELCPVAPPITPSDTAKCGIHPHRTVVVLIFVCDPLN